MLRSTTQQEGREGGGIGMKEGREHRDKESGKREVMKMSEGIDGGERKRRGEARENNK